VSAVVYDAGMLIALESGDARRWLQHGRADVADREVLVPAGALAQVWRSGPQPLLSRALRGATVVPLTADQARRAGALAGRAGVADVVDASVVECAWAHGAVIVTSDPDDIRRLVEASGAAIRVMVI